MRVFVTGGTGLIGRNLVAALLSRGDCVSVVTRDAAAAGKVLPERVSLTEADPAEGGSWQREVDGADVIVNLAGEPIFGSRWTRPQKERIRTSRLRTTENIVEAIAACRDRPGTFISGSAVGYYGPRGSEQLSEDAPAGDGFLADVTGQWEAAARQVSSLGTRLVLLRTGIVLASGGGALERMALPFRFHVGGPAGSGSQWISWIHIDDLVGMILWAMEATSIEGPINAVAPGPVTNRQFAATLADELGTKSWLPVPRTLLRIGLGQVADIVTTGQRVIPARAVAAGFHFRYCGLGEALHQILVG